MISDDEPIRTKAHDLLGREPVAARVAEIIASRPTSAPLVLALHGPWGSGKSSVLGLVREKLEGPDVVFVEFQPWLFSSVEQLVPPFFATVYSALLKAGAEKNMLRDALQKFGGLLTAASKVVGFEIDFEKLTEKTPADLRDELCTVSAKLAKRVVVLIDDVDRLPLDELGQLLKLVRLCGSFPYFTYILAYDRRVVSAAMRDAYRGDSDFLDKIVQVEVPLPPVPPRLLADYVQGGLKELGDALKLNVDKALEMFEVRDDETRQTLAYIRDDDDPLSLIRSLRDAKRFLNGLETTLPLVSTEVDLVDFVCIELLRIFYPLIFDKLYELRFVLAAFDTRGGDDRRLRRQEQHKALATELRNLPQGELAVRILAKVFPAFHATLFAQNQHHAPRDGLRRNMRASDPTHVEKYFQLRVPLDAVPRKEVRAAFDQVVGAASAEAGRELLTMKIKEVYDASKLSAFLEGVYLEVDRLEPAAIVTVIEAVAEAAQVLALPPMHERQMSPAAICTLRLATRLPRATADELMQRLIATANGPYAVQVMLYADAIQRQPENLGFDFAGARASFVARIERELLTDGDDLFVLYEYEWDSVLMLWGQREKAAAYLVQCLASQPEHWVDLARYTLVRGGMSPTVNLMDLSTLRQIAALEPLADAARDASPNGLGADDQKFVSLFCDELQVVPQLLSELDDIAAVAQQLSVFSPELVPNVAWSVPEWEHSRQRLEPVLGKEPWWPRLVNVYSVFAEMRAELDALETMTSPEAAAVAITKVEAVHRRAQSLAAEIQGARNGLAVAVGAQTAFRFA